MKKDLSLYIHIPFCVRKCVYCDFLSFDKSSEAQYIQYVNALCNEIRMYQPYADRYLVKTIYFGGGTPTLIDESLIEMILKTIESVFEVDRFPEITIEGNPGTIRVSDLIKYKSYGINRLSIGMQSMDDELLKTLGRIHDEKTFLTCFNEARRAGFKNISVDVMSGIPGQEMASLVDTLTRLCELHPEHISTYSLQVEDGTPLASDDRLLSMIPSEDMDRRMYAMTKKVLASYGYQRYEFSNYSRPGFESKHNSVYWTGGDYLGFGIGAASLFKGERFSNTRDMVEYERICNDIRDELYKDTDGIMLYDAASKALRKDVSIMLRENKMEEFMFLGLRMIRGVSRDLFRKKFDRDMFEVFGAVINKYVAEGYMDNDNHYVWLTDKGIDVSNYILADFLLDK